MTKDALAPIATPSIMGSAATPNSAAVATPIGIMTGADDALEMNVFGPHQTKLARAAMQIAYPEGGTGT